jgi:hypothetical protein
MARRGALKRQRPRNEQNPRRSAFAADCSACIDTLFDDLPIKNCRLRTIFRPTATTAFAIVGCVTRR